MGEQLSGDLGSGRHARTKQTGRHRKARGIHARAKARRRRIGWAAAPLIAGVVALGGSQHASGQDEPPDPINPSQGESQLLDIINSIPINDIEQAKDNFPVPYVVIASAEGAEPTIANNRAGAPTRIDADQDKATGKGGHDVVVEVNTELAPTPHLRLNIDRLGAAPFASDLSVVVAFPFDAFNGEDGSSGGENPNLFFGYQTQGAFDPATGDYQSGGFAPQSLEYRFVPGVLAGTEHIFELQLDTIGANNPIRYLGGHFDGNADTGIQDAIGMAALADPVPATASLAIDVAESPTSSDPSSTTDTELSMNWTANTPTKLTFDYLENESFPVSTPEFNSTVTVDKMPTEESLSIHLDEDDPDAGFTLMHQSNAPIDEVSFLKERSDGLVINGTATDVPTDVALTTDLDGAYSLDVDANTLDLTANISQAGGFLDTSGFLGYDIGLLNVALRNAPDLTATLDPDTDRYIVEATNTGESIEAASLLLDDGPVTIVDGKADVDRDGDIDGADDGLLGGFTVIDGMIDLDSSGAATVSDSGDIAGSLPVTEAVEGLIDLNGDGQGDSADDGLLTVLALPPAWDESPTHHILSLADDGVSGTIAGRLVNVSKGGLDLDGPPVIDGGIDVNDDGTVDGDDDGTLAFGVTVIDGGIDLNEDDVVNGSDDGLLFGDFGPTIQNGLVDINGDDVANGSDDGGLTMQTFEVGTTAAAPLQASLNTKPGSRLIPGREIAGACTVTDIPAADTTFNVVFPPPSFGFGYEIDPPSGGIDEVSCAAHVGTVLSEATFTGLPDKFNFDFDPDEHLTLTAEDGTGPNSATLGSGEVHTCDDADLDGVCEEADDSGGIPGTGKLLGEKLRDVRARIEQTPSFEGFWQIDELEVTDGLVSPDDGTFAGTLIADGKVDVNDDGTVNNADDGRFLGKRVINGKIDVDGDGDTDADDDGTISGTAVNYDTGRPDAALFLDGVQVDVSTVGGLDALPVASPSVDNYARFVDKGADGPKRFAAGVFGIDEFRYSSDDDERTTAVHYRADEAHRLIAEFDSAFGGKYFGKYDTDLALDIQDLPAEFNLVTDLATELTYDASSAISTIDLTGTVDDTDDDENNGTAVAFHVDQLPSQLAFNLAADVTNVVDGKLDVTGNDVVNNNDDAVLAGVRVIDGGLDLTGDGVVGGGDGGFFVGVPVIAGKLDVNEQDGVTDDDDGAVAGATLRMNGGIDAISLDLSSDNKVVKTDYRLIQADLTDVPAQWAVNWGGGRFLLESKDAAGNASPLGQVSAQVSTSNDQAENADRKEPFTLDGSALSGPVLDAAPGPSDGCRVNYSQFAQEVDKRYYNAAAAADATDPSAVFERLQELYCDSEQLDAGEDHAIARMGTIDGEEAVDYGSFQFSGFQKVSFVPDADGGHFTFRAPTPGEHPLFAGFEDGDEFTTLQVGNIPDNVDVEIDTSKQVTYDATDDTNASFKEIDVYSGPLPIAQDNDDATRVIVRPVGVDATPKTSFIHTGWKLGFPSGGAFLDNEQELEVLLLTQDGSNRITAGLGLEDLLAGYAIDLFSFDVNDRLCIVPDPLGGCIVEIPVAWELFEAKAGVVNDADGFTPDSLASMTPETLTGDSGKPDVAGFLTVYTKEGSPAAFDPSGPAASGGEYVPIVTVEEESFREATAGISLNLEPLDPDILVFSIDVDFVVTGDLVFDFWSTENIDFTDDDAIPFIPEVGFVDKPSYTNNSPFHIIPGLNPADPIQNADFDNVRNWVYTFNGWHGYGRHFDPFK